MNTGESRVSRPEWRRAPRYRYRALLEIEWGSARLASESPLWLECQVKRVEPGRGMGVTVELRENQSQRHYQDLLARLRRASNPAVY